VALRLNGFSLLATDWDPTALVNLVVVLDPPQDWAEFAIG
jgi:hypothetical protein